jgi:hypothetical protein
MKANVEWIKRTMDANGLVAAGPMRIITTEMGRENYTFDVAQPVRKAGGAEGDTTAAAPSAPMTGLKLQGPVTYVQTAARRAAMGSYTGYMAELENVRNALRAWALTQGFEATGRPYESYKNGIDQAFTENGEYDVYWDLK